jgi:hypothetical protein
MNYSDPYIEHGIDFAKHIKMFVTVTSSLNAIFITYMGVTASIEGVRSGTRGISFDLHSFAAKIMLMRNPKRLYQINQPVLQMGNILIKAIDAAEP